ncbi:hypothetical protein KA025_00190 [Candidatus Saccharibacteria bacterium]|nr:hypothetical protein [Candidatus Saccharibacteria bacterium]MBP7834491.1 hypothetical protein [Candidatus Saccharibacteria bacterium]
MPKDTSYTHIERQVDSSQANSLDKVRSEINTYQDLLDTTTDTEKLREIIPEIIRSLNQQWHSQGLLNSSITLFGEVFVPESNDEDNNMITLNRITIDEETGVSKGFQVLNLPVFFEGERFERQQIVHILRTEPQYSRDLAQESEVSYNLYGIPSDIVIFDDKPDIEYLSQTIPETLEDIDIILLNPGSKKEKYQALSHIRFEELDGQGFEAYEHLASYINSLLGFKMGMPYVIKNSELIFGLDEDTENEEVVEEAQNLFDDTYNRLVPESAKQRIYAYIGGIAIIDNYKLDENTIESLASKRLALNSMIITRQGLRPALIPLTDKIVVRPLV